MIRESFSLGKLQISQMPWFAKVYPHNVKLLHIHLYRKFFSEESFSDSSSAWTEMSLPGFRLGFEVPPMNLAPPKLLAPLRFLLMLGPPRSSPPELLKNLKVPLKNGQTFFTLQLCHNLYKNDKVIIYHLYMTTKVSYKI